MKKLILLFIIFFSISHVAQTYSNTGSVNQILSDSSDLPTGIWNGGNFGGAVSYGAYSGSNIYFAQAENFHKAEEGSDKIESLEETFMYSDGSNKKAFKINGDNIYLIYELGSSYDNKITKSKLSNLSASSSTQFSEITNGINKFKEIDGYVFLAHNKDGIISDKLVGKDFLNDVQDDFIYTQDFIDFTVNGSHAYLIADNGTNTRTIEVIDFSNKSNVTKVGEVVVTSAEKVVYSNGHLYIACSDNQGMQIVDVSTPTNPTIVGNYQEGNTTIYQLIVDETKAYVSTSNAFKVLDISTPSNPYDISWEWLDNLAINSNTKFTAVNSGKVYYLDNGSFGIIETSPNVALGKKYLSPISSETVYSDGNTLVVYDYNNYYFASLADNYSPNFYDALKADFIPEYFSIDENYFYLSDYNNLYTYDITDLSNPISNYAYIGQSVARNVKGDLAAVGGFNASFKYYL